MNKFRLFFFIFVSFCFGFVETVDAVVMVVEDNAILNSDVLQQSLYIASQKNISPYDDKEVFDSIYEEVLGLLVDNLVLYDLAKKDTNLVVDALLVEERLQEEIQRRVDIVGSVSELEKMFGEPLSMIRAKLRKELNKSFLIELYTSSLYPFVSPSLSDIKVFYKENQSALPLLEDRVDFSVLEWPVVFEEEKTAAVEVLLESLKDSLLAGVPFSVLAGRHSDDVFSAKSGGSLGYTERGTLFAEYEAVAYGLEEGEFGGPFSSPVGYHLVFLEQRLGEKIKTSHILKKIFIEEGDIKNSVKNFELFLSELNVYNSVNTFDSLCAHYNKKGASFQGVFSDFPIKDLPEFLPDSLVSSVGFSPFLIENNNIYLFRFSSFSSSEPVSLKNSYDNLYVMTQNKLLSDKIQEVIKIHSDRLHIKRFY